MSGVLAILLGGGPNAGGGTPLSASASGTFFYGSTAGAGTATTTTCTITASGGTAPYHYAWTRTSGDTGTAISSSTAAAVHWARVYSTNLGRTDDSYWKCVVSDSDGASVTVSSLHAQTECVA